MPLACASPSGAKALGALTDEDKFLFDLRGFLVVKNVLSLNECEELLHLADDVWPRQPDDGPFRRFNGISAWGQPFVDLMDDDRLLPYLVELVGNRLRIDHDYCIFMRAHASRNTLHGGPWRYESDHWYRYHDGVMRNGLTVATWNLSDAPAGAGGFACVPGSHKSNFLKHMPRDVARFERAVDWVVQPPMSAGERVDLHRGADPRHGDLDGRTRAPHLALQVQPAALDLGQDPLRSRRTFQRRRRGSGG